uniref:Uncharacterized protein n=1 Tax=Knipowitschia caucasica TaxID=637954 RepID=A0AAV2LEG2_KNICA
MATVKTCLSSRSSVSHPSGDRRLQTRRRRKDSGGDVREVGEEVTRTWGWCGPWRGGGFRVRTARLHLSVTVTVGLQGVREGRALGGRVFDKTPADCVGPVFPVQDGRRQGEETGPRAASKTRLHY